MQVYLLSGLSNHAHLFEIYHACKVAPLSTKLIKEFHTEIKTLYTKTDFIWNRRQDFQGCTLKVGYFEDNPLVTTVKNSSVIMNASSIDEDYLIAGNLMMVGTQTELFANLMKELNFSVEWVYEESHLYGKYHPKNQSWSGIIGQLKRGDAEMSIFQLDVILSRSLAVTFSNPTGTNDYGLYMQKPSQSLTWSTYTKVFVLDYWVTVVFVAVICWLLLVLLFQWMDVRKQQKNENEMGSKFINILKNIGSGLSVVGLSFGQQDVNHGRELEYSSKGSMKMLYLTVCTFGLLNYMVWDAGLTSTLTVKSFELPINSIEGLLGQSRFQVVVFEGTASESYFSDAAQSETYSVAKELWKTSIENNKKALVRSTDSLEKAILQDKGNVVFADILSVNLWGHYPCKIATVPTRYNGHSTAYPFKRNSTYINSFNSALNRMMETGSLNSIHRHSQKFRPLTNCKDETELAIGYQNILSAFVLPASGFVMAIFIWVVEYSWTKLCKVERKTKSAFKSRPHSRVENGEIKTILTISQLAGQLDNRIVTQHKAVYIGIINKLLRKLDPSDVMAYEQKI